MIITCPSCRTRFRIAPAALGSAGPTVRCSSCSERWFVEPFTEAAPPPPLAAAAGDRRRSAAASAERSAKRRGTLVGWLLASTDRAAADGSLVGRNEIAARLPTTVPLYQLLGLPLELPLGMEFREPELAPAAGCGPPVLVVTGEIANVSGQQREVPPIRVALLDADRQELDFGLFDPPQPSLGPGGLARFEVELGAPPPEASDYSVSFGEPR